MTAQRPRLSGLTILLTRPAGQADEWLTHFQALGADVTHIPTLQIDLLPPPTDLGEQLRTADLGIFVSTNAVNALAKALQEQIAECAIPWHCVGDKTRHAAESVGFITVANSATDSESLLLSHELQPPLAKRIVIIRGEGGRQLISESLAARGADVRHCELYRRSCAWQNETLLASYLQRISPRSEHIISATSVDSLNYTFLLAQKGEMAANVRRATVLAPSRRVAAAAQRLGFDHLVQAPSMRLTDIEYVLNEWWAQQR